MNLLDALVEVVESQQIKGIRKREDGSTARLTYFAFTDDGDTAYLSEMEVEELVPLLERWCEQQRAEMGSIQ